MATAPPAAMVALLAVVNPRRLDDGRRLGRGSGGDANGAPAPAAAAARVRAVVVVVVVAVVAVAAAPAAASVAVADAVDLLGVVRLAAGPGPLLVVVALAGLFDEGTAEDPAQQQEAEHGADDDAGDGAAAERVAVRGRDDVVAERDDGHGRPLARQQHAGRLVRRGSGGEGACDWSHYGRRCVWTTVCCVWYHCAVRADRSKARV